MDYHNHPSLILLAVALETAEVVIFPIIIDLFFSLCLNDNHMNTDSYVFSFFFLHKLPSLCKSRSCSRMSLGRGK